MAITRQDWGITCWNPAAEDRGARCVCGGFGCVGAAFPIPGEVQSQDGDTDLLRGIGTGTGTGPSEGGIGWNLGFGLETIELGA